MSGDANGGHRTWQLSLYEQSRTPHELITEEKEIAVSPRGLNSELMCPICLDMLRQTMTTKECLHRFCHDCIITALRNGNKECPTCRKKLVSKRSLRADPNFDELISKIYPNREEYEAQQEKVFAKFANRNMGILAQVTNGEALEFPTNETTSDDVELIFKPIDFSNSGCEGEMPVRFVKTTVQATAEHLVKYLSMRHLLDAKVAPVITESDKLLNKASEEAFLFTLYVATGPGEFKPLAGNTIIKEVLQMYWKSSKPMELHYAYKMPSV